MVGPFTWCSGPSLQFWAVIPFSASRNSLSTPGAKLNVAEAQLSFGGGENNCWHVLDSLRACAMFIVGAHVCVADLD